MLITDFFDKVKNKKDFFIVEGRHSYTFDEVIKMSKGLACIISKNQKINYKALIFTERNINQVVSLFACQFAGITFTIVDNRYNKIFYDRVVSDFKPDIIICDNTFKFKSNSLLFTFDNDFKNKLNKFHLRLIKLSKNFKQQNICFTDLAHVIYTSGSTGFPKGIAVSHRMMYEAIVSMADYMPLSKKDKILSILPFHFDYGYAKLLLALIFNCRFYLYSYTLPGDYIKFVKKNNITYIASVPNHLEIISKLSRSIAPSVKLVMTSGGMTSKNCYFGIKKVFNKAKVLNTYGITESFFSTYLPLKHEKLILQNCVGIPMRNVEIKILKKNKECKPFELGEIVHYGSHISDGYYNNYDLTKKVFKKNPLDKKNGHLNKCVFTGDIGYKDKKGFIYYVTRKDDIFKFNGVRTNINQLESLYAKVLKLKQETVLVRKKDTHDKVYFFISNSDKLNHRIYLEEINNLILKKITNIHRPSKVFIIDKFPTTASGKIDRKRLLTLCN